MSFAELKLGTGQIHVWHVGLDAPPQLVQRSRSLLVAEELRRGARRVLPSDRARLLLSHVALRCVLASYLATTPGAVSIARARHGKPHVHPGTGSGLHFNLSHSGDLALIALSRQVTVGVDVERVRPSSRLDVDDTLTYLFSPREQRLLAAVAPQLRLEAFTRCWTRKEAVVKAMGAGLSSALAGLDVGACAGPLKHATGSGHDSPVAGWTIVELPTALGYVASVAWPGAAQRVVNRSVSVECLAEPHLDLDTTG